MKKIGLGIAILLFAIIISLCSSGMGLLVIGIGIVGLIFQSQDLWNASKITSRLLGRRRERKIDICGGKECMKKELRILVILIAVLLVGTVGYYFMPKKFGKNVNPSEVDHINVFDGNTGTGFTITDSEDIEYIVANIQGISMKRDGISLGRTGYSFKISYINSNDKDIIPVFILNSDNTICKDPFFYRCDGGLCFDYLKACEEKYRTNVTESIEEK